MRGLCPNLETCLRRCTYLTGVPLAVGLLAAHVSCLRPGIALLAVGRIAGAASDDVPVLPQVLEDGTPHNRLGGFGSAIAYTGTGTRYVSAPDRGPGGETSFAVR